MNLNWKRPLVYVLIPILIFLAFVGFPPPFAPPRATKPGQEASVPADEARKKRSRQGGGVPRTTRDGTERLTDRT